MLGFRDVGYSLLITLLLSLGFHYRPLWSARAFIEKQAEAGFRQAYTGHRYTNGDLITPRVDGSAQTDPLGVRVIARSLDIQAQSISWTGSRAEFVLHHTIRIEDATPTGRDVGHDIHVKLSKVSGRWIYAHFEVRGRDPITPAADQNPFAEKPDKDS